MDSFNNLLKKENVGQVILSILFIVYLIMGYSTPAPIAHIIDTLLGKAVVILVALLLVMYFNPILAVLGIFVAFQLIRQSTIATGTYGMQYYLPTEEKKYSAMTEYNQFPYTLEQEVVKKMAPVNRSGLLATDDFTFNPVLDDLHDAAPINYKGVV